MPLEKQAIVINKLQPTVPNKKAYLYIREIEDNYKP